MAKNPKNKKHKTLSIAEMLKLQSQLIKDHDAIPGKAGYLNWSPERASEWKTKQQLLLKEKEKLEIEFKNSKEIENQENQENSGITPTMGLKAVGVAAAFGNDAAVVGAFGLLAAGVTKKIFRGLSKKKEEEYQEEEIPQGEIQKPKAPKRVQKPKSKIAKPGFLMSAEDKIRARAERINSDNSEENASKGTPEKIEADGIGLSNDNSVIISILNKILNAFEDDNERMRRSVRDTEEKQLESDPTVDKVGSPEKVKDKKTDMNKLLMLGAIAGLFGSALLFRSAIGEMLSPITDMLGITDPTADADKEDYNFDIMDMLGVTSLLGMLGIGGKVAAQKVATTAAERAARGAAVVGAKTGARVLGKTGIAAAEQAANGNAVRAFQRGGGAVASAAAGAPQKNIAGKIAAAIGKILPKKIPGLVGRSIPFLGAAIGAGFGIYELVKGNYVGAALSVAGGTVGPATAFPAAVLDIANDVYKEVYGQYPADDLLAVGKDKVAERMIEIKNSVEEAATDYLKAKAPEKVESKGAKLNQKEAQGLLQSNKESPLSERDLKLYGGLDRITDIANGGKGDMSAASSAGGAVASRASGGKGDMSAASSAGGAVASGASGGGGTSGGAGASGDFSPTGAPVASSPPPASAGSAVTAATMGASEAQNSVIVLPPIVNNESNTMKSGNENASKAQKMTMQVRLNDDVFRKAVESTAAVLKAA